jgi:hypothetical protein
MPTYVGWCPTITGRISFNSLTAWGNTASPVHACIETEEADAPPNGLGRLIVAHHDRVTNDDPWLAAWRAMLGHIGLKRLGLRRLGRDRFDYFMIARGVRDSTGDEHLEGEILFLGDAEESRLWRQNLRPRIEALKQARIRTYVEIDALHDQFLQTFSQLQYLTLQRSDYNEPFYRGFFVLRRDGELRVTLQDLPVFIDPPALTFITKTPARGAQNTNAQHQMMLEEIDRANLMFRFVRDLFHPHYHHKISNDSITRVFEEDGAPNWRFQTERALYRAVVAARRGNATHDLSMAQGRLAYLRTFRQLFDQGSGGALPERTLDTLDQSLCASIAAEHARDNQHRVVVTGIFVLPFAILGLLVSLIDTFQRGPGNPFPDVERLLRGAYGLVTGSVEFMTTIVAVVVLFYFYMLSTRSSPKAGVEREVRRLGEHLRRKQRSTAQSVAQTKSARGRSFEFTAYMTSMILVGVAFVAGAFFLAARTIEPPAHGKDYSRFELADPFTDQRGRAVEIVAHEARYYDDGMRRAPALRVQCWNDKISVALRSGQSRDSSEQIPVRLRLNRRPSMVSPWKVTADGRYLLLEEENGGRQLAADLIETQSLLVGDDQRTIQFHVEPAREAVAELVADCLPTTPAHAAPAE